MMGGSESTDFLAPAASGENTLVQCENGDYSADIDIARAVPRAPEFPERLDAPSEVETLGVTTIEGLAELLGVDPAATSKAMPVVKADGTLVLALVRGDDRLSESKLLSLFSSDFRPAEEEEIQAVFGAGGGVDFPSMTSLLSGLAGVGAKAPGFDFMRTPNVKKFVLPTVSANSRIALPNVSIASG